LQKQFFLCKLKIKTFIFMAVCWHRHETLSIASYSEVYIMRITAKRLAKRTVLPKWAQERLMVAVIRQCRAAAMINHMMGFPFDPYIMPELKRRDFE
jgi:hypothetical protein